MAGAGTGTPHSPSDGSAATFRGRGMRRHRSPRNTVPTMSIIDPAHHSCKWTWRARPDPSLASPAGEIVPWHDAFPRRAEGRVDQRRSRQRRCTSLCFPREVRYSVDYGTGRVRVIVLGSPIDRAHVPGEVFPFTALVAAIRPRTRSATSTGDRRLPTPAVPRPLTRHHHRAEDIFRRTARPSKYMTSHLSIVP